MRGSNERRRGRVARVLATTMIAGSILAVPAVSESATVVVKAKFRKFDPEVRRIVKKSHVKWKAPAGGPDHSVVAYSGPWNLMQALYAGNSFSYQFTKVGVYKYRCYTHGEIVDGKCEGMCGKVKVRAP